MKYNDQWNRYQKALFFDQQGDWSKAHNLVDGHPGKEAAHIHAYLHRKEGDQWNAGYWYRQANKEMFVGSLEEEWTYLWELFNK
jgi:hypothetical protein